MNPKLIPWTLVLIFGQFSLSWGQSPNYLQIDSIYSRNGDDIYLLSGIEPEHLRKGYVIHVFEIDVVQGNIYLGDLIICDISDHQIIACPGPEIISSRLERLQDHGFLLLKVSNSFKANFAFGLRNTSRYGEGLLGTALVGMQYHLDALPMKTKFWFGLNGQLVPFYSLSRYQEINKTYKHYSVSLNVEIGYNPYIPLLDHGLFLGYRQGLIPDEGFLIEEIDHTSSRLTELGGNVKRFPGSQVFVGYHFNQNLYAETSVFFHKYRVKTYFTIDGKGEVITNETINDNYFGLMLGYRF